MNIITERKVIYKDKMSSACGCSGADGSSIGSAGMPAGVSQTDPTGQKKAGMLWDKAKGTWVKASDWLNAHPQFKATAGSWLGQITDNIFGGLFAKPTQTTAPSTPQPIIMESSSPAPTVKKGMGNGAKIAIGVGVVALVGFIIYKVSKKK